MWTDPEPNDFSILDNSNGPIVDVDLNSVNWFSVVCFLELQTWMV